ncbi:MAG: LysM peptidoglycan-binding domain-containing M23 family metallopeptidase [Myxococcota bacterium]|nr:peptidoglycan DD-metalloendopeptidase family protein [Myxococcales bacterium]
MSVARAASLVAACALAAAACSAPPPAPAPLERAGTYHVVQRGENLFRIGQRYGVPAEVLREVNGIDDVTQLRVGQRLWIPAAGIRADGPPGSTLADRVRAEVRAEAGVDFAWPLRGTVTSRYGRRRRGPHEGIDIAAPRGTDVVAAEAGKVIHVGRMGDYGKLVVVKHSGNFRSVYAHLDRYHVREGSFVEKGERIAEVGRTGNASGPHLHFEIRELDRPRDPMLYLP